MTAAAPFHPPLFERAGAPAPRRASTPDAPTPRMPWRTGPARVLFVNHTAVLGGAEVALLRLLAALDRDRFTPVALLFSDGPLVRRIAGLGVETHVLPLDERVVNARKDSLGPRSLFRLRDIATVLAYVRRLAELIRALGADLVHANTLKADVIGGMAAAFAGRPLVWHVHELLQAGYLPAFARSAFLALGRSLPDHIVTNSRSTLSYLVAGQAERASVVHPGLDGAALADLDMAPAVSERPAGGAPLVVMVGRIAPFKGQHVFIRAAAQVARAFPRARFQIVGGPLFGEHEYERQIKGLAAEVGLADAIEFTGFRDDTAALTASADVLVHASVLGEGFGQVVVEGMAAGKPVVATNGGAIPEIVVDGVTGVLVPMSDPGAMAGAICRLLGDPAAAGAMGRLARRRVLEEFTADQTALRIGRVYDQVLRGGVRANRTRLAGMAVAVAYLGLTAGLRRPEAEECPSPMPV